MRFKTISAGGGPVSDQRLEYRTSSKAIRAKAALRQIEKTLLRLDAAMPWIAANKLGD